MTGCTSRSGRERPRADAVEEEARAGPACGWAAGRPGPALLAAWTKRRPEAARAPGAPPHSSKRSSCRSVTARVLVGAGEVGHHALDLHPARLGQARGGVDRTASGGEAEAAPCPVSTFRCTAQAPARAAAAASARSSVSGVETTGDEVVLDEHAPPGRGAKPARTTMGTLTPGAAQARSPSSA